MITAIVSKILPFAVFVALTLAGWTVCCSCCGYSYCPVVCRRDLASRPFSMAERSLSVLIVMFSGLSIIVPAIMNFNYTREINDNLKYFLCGSLMVNHQLKE